MKQFVILSVLLIILASCKNQKDVVYIDSSDVNISKSQYRSLKKGKISIEEKENDTLVIKKIYPQKVVGKLYSVQHRQIKMFLEKILGEKFAGHKKTLIHLYRQNDGRIKEDSQFKKYWKYIDLHSNEFQAFLIGTKFSKIEGDPENNIYVDPYNQLDNLFFKNSDLQLNHILIKPDGELNIYYGFDDILNVLDMAYY